jgi:hypothetical protein
LVLLLQEHGHCWHAPNNKQLNKLASASTWIQRLLGIFKWIIKYGLSFETFLLWEFPKLIFVFSLECMGMFKEYTILLEEQAFSLGRLQKCDKMFYTLDVHTTMYPLDVVKYQLAKQGKFDDTYLQRKKQGSVR